MIPYAPWVDPRLSRKPGTLPLDPADWIESGPDRATQMAYRKHLIAGERGTVFAALPESAAAQAELLDILAAHLGVLPPRTDEPPLLIAGRLVQEDFCLMQQRAPGEEYRLTAAILCFPSRWSLAEKIGRPLTAIHDPVPEYGDDLAKRVNRLFDGIRADRPLWRANWTIHPTDELFLPSGEIRENAPGGGALFIRVERQTFLRLPRTGAVVFGIRTHVDPLDALSSAEAAALHAALAERTAEETAYRGGGDLHAAAMASLAARAA